MMMVNVSITTWYGHPTPDSTLGDKTFSMHEQLSRISPSIIIYLLHNNTPIT